MSEAVCAADIDLNALILYIGQRNAIQFPDAKIYEEIILRIKNERSDVYYPGAEGWANMCAPILGINEYNHKIMAGSHSRYQLMNWEIVWPEFFKTTYPDVDDLI